MKKIGLTTLATILISFLGFSQSKNFSITWSYGLAGGSKPTLTELNKEKAISLTQAENLVKEFLETSKIDFKCIYNGCQNRAMIMSLLLREKGIQHYKIWNFDPFKISIFNAQDALDVDDILGLKDSRILWDFHVAISILVKGENNLTDTLVIDPSFSPRPIKVKEWLSFQNSPNSYYTFLDPEWYNYVTLMPGTTFNCNGVSTNLNIPNCFPYLLTGDFYKYSSYNHKVIAEELATNEQITKAKIEIIDKLKLAQQDKVAIISIVSDYNYFKSILQETAILDSKHPFFKYVNEYKKGYLKAYDQWTKELQRLN